MTDISFSYTHDADITNEAFFALIGRPYVCPWCSRSKVPERRRGKVIVPNQHWVNTPLRKEDPKWVCIGCYINVYCTCNSFGFAEHPDLGLVERVAELEGLSADEFRRRVWEHQMVVIDADRRAGRLEPGSIGLEQRLKRLLLGEA